uniref:MAM domain-containing protein n=1 Tax=Tetranychus urticae TaxID=32264 RepID=T1K4W3_TETUR
MVHSVVCLPIDKLCDYNIDCLDGIDEHYCGPCEFDSQSLCGWTNEGEDDWVTFDENKGNEATMTVRLRNDLESSSKKVFDLDHTNEWRDELLEVGSLDLGYYIQFVLDVESTDDTRVHIGLGSFQLMDCDLINDPTTITNVPVSPKTDQLITAQPTKIPTKPTTDVVSAYS